MGGGADEKVQQTAEQAGVNMGSPGPASSLLGTGREAGG